TVDVSRARTAEDASAAADHAARQLAANLATATARVRNDLASTGHFHPQHPVSFPTTIWLAKNGVLSPRIVGPQPRTAGLTLVFDSTGPRAFPTAYKDKLQAIFTSAQATL